MGFGKITLVIDCTPTIKCKKFANTNFWVLPIETEVDDRLFKDILKKTSLTHG